MNALGAGVFALYEFYMYALLPVSLTVTNCKFQNNKSGTAGAIEWEGINLIIADSEFSYNRMFSDAVITFVQYFVAYQLSVAQLDLEVDTSVFSITN